MFKTIRRKKQYDKVSTAIRFLQQLKSNMSTLPPTTQCLISYSLSILDNHLELRDMQKIRNPKVLSYLLYQLHQEFFPEQKKTLTLFHVQNAQNKKYIAKHFLEHSSTIVRSSAITSYVTFATNSQKQHYYKQAQQTTDFATKKAIAQGFYFAFYNAWIRESNTAKKSLRSSDLLSTKPVYAQLYKNFVCMKNFITVAQKQSPKKFQLYKKWLENACELDPQNREYLFMSSFFQENRQIVRQIKQAIALSKKKSQYLKQIYDLILMQTLMQNGEKQQVKSYLQHNQAFSPFIRTHFADLSFQVGKNRPALRIYEKNYAEDSSEYSPFTEVFTNHIHMVKIHMVDKKTQTAKQLLEYLYQLYQREQYNRLSSQQIMMQKIISKPIFRAIIKEKYPNFQIDFK